MGSIPILQTVFVSGSMEEYIFIMCLARLSSRSLGEVPALAHNQ